LRDVFRPAFVTAAFLKRVAPVLAEPAALTLEEDLTSFLFGCLWPKTLPVSIQPETSKNAAAAMDIKITNSF
jgi:hypothetical protein